MTGQATFGDFATAATWHLGPAAPAGTRTPGTRPGPLPVTVPGMRAVARSLSRHADDARAVLDALPVRDRRHAQPWARAARQACEALDNAAASLDHAQPPPSPGLASGPGTAPPPGSLEAAAAAITLSRDLLHTHLATTPAGARQHTSDWALVITTPPVARALLHQAGGWARQAAARAGHAATGTRAPAGARRAMHAACQWLNIAAWAIDAAHAQQPVTTGDMDLLAAIPVNAPEPRHALTSGDPVPDMCQGIVATASRLTAAARLSAARAAWSPAMTSESLRRAAEHATITHWNCRLILATLASLDRHNGDGRLASLLGQAAEAAGQARAAWYAAATAWDAITTDTHGMISRTAREAAALALHTGRLAYADPAWTPATGPACTPRAPGDLITRPGDLAAVITAVHHASHATARLGHATRAQLTTAARAGRLIVPTRTLSEDHDIPYRLAPAPLTHAAPLLAACQHAAEASHHATTAIGAIAAAVRAPSRTITTATTIQASGHHRPAAPALPRHLPARTPGPAERALTDLGVTNPADLRQAAAHDQAITELIIRATRHAHAHAGADAQDPDRGTRPPPDRDLNTSPDTAELISHILATSGDRAPATLRPPAEPPAARAARRDTILLSTELPAGLTSPAKARAAVRRALRERGLTALADDAALITSEIVANAAEHAGPAPIGLVLREHHAPSGRHGITCEITDASPEPPAPRDAGPDSERGRGLAITTAITTASGITYHPGGGKTLTFILTTPEPAPAPAAGPGRQPDPAPGRHPEPEPEAEAGA